MSDRLRDDDNRRQHLHRRAFLGATAAALAAVTDWRRPARAAGPLSMRFGLVTYLWGKDMDLPTLIEVCERSGLTGVELRTQHAHGVEPSLSQSERAAVRQRFADSRVTLVGYGSNAEFHDKDPARVRHNIELTRQYIQLMHDCGGSGVKVKPNDLPAGVPREQTIEQIGRALNEVAAFGADLGQEIRLEVHGSGTSELPVIQAIMEIAEHPNATVCWNSNDVDLRGQGLESNFELVKHRLGQTVHVRELTLGDYPYPRLFRLLKQANYSGWMLLEARTNPAEKVTALIEQREAFERLVASD